MDSFFDGLAATPSPVTEPNDTLATASPLVESLYSITGNGIDWYSFVAQAGGIIDLSMTATAAPLDLNMVLHNPDGAAVRANFSATPTEAFSYVAPTSGTYYLQVTTAQFGATPPAGMVTTYTLDLDLPQFIAPDGNDSRATATPLAEGVHEIVGTRVDWFRLDSSPGFIEIAMTEVQHLEPGDPRDDPRNLNIELYNEVGQVVAASLTAGAESIRYFAPASGPYFLKVYSAQFVDAAPADLILSYTLDVNLPDARAPDGNDTLATATVLAEGMRTVAGTGVDWFRFDSAAGLVSLSMVPMASADLAAQDLNMVLYNAAGQALRAQPVSGSGAESFTHFIPTAGTYYVKISPAIHATDAAAAGFPLDYSITLDLPAAIPPDGNDSQTTATPLAGGVHQIVGTRVDWFRLDSPVGTITIRMDEIELLEPGDPRDDPRNLNIELYNARGESVAASLLGATSETITYFAPEPGNYFLKVYSAQFVDAAPADLILSYTLTVDLPVALLPDGNNSMATATVLTEGVRTVAGTGVDWFRFDSVSGDIRLSMTPLAVPGVPAQDLNVVLYDAAGTSLRSEVVSGTGAESFTYLAGTAGTYFVKVFPALFGDAAPLGFPLNYQLELALPTAVPSDGNDTLATATPIGTGLITRSGTGVDWFRIDTGPGVIDVTMTPIANAGQAALDLNMELYNAQGQSVRNGFVDGPNPETIRFVAPETGVYYLQVYWPAYPDAAPNGYNLNYTLDVDLPLNTWSVTLDFGPVRGASVTTYDIDNDGFDEIFVATSKALDADGNEIRPAGLIVLEHDGTIKWTKTFAAAPGPDSQTGKTYNTSSVTTAPVFSDINGDGRIEILVGTGGDNNNDFGAVGQPGDLGALYALDASGNTLWSHVTRDSFGANDAKDGRPDGVYGSPRVFDIDGDGVREVIFTSWDHNLYVLDGRTGRLEREVNLHDTAGATPAVADLNRDGVFELVVPSDITDNVAAGLPLQGGILHVLSNYGVHNVGGWTQQVFTSTHPDYRGRFEEQSLWSSPQIVDLNRDGSPEIVVGTGNFFQDGRGQYLKVWNADGTLRMTLPTIGRTLASPLIADLDGDGSPEIIAATLQGYVHAWNAAGVPVFATQARPYTDNPDAGTNLPIARSPVAVDLDGDGKLEIMLSVGSQMVILDSTGRQISSLTEAERVFHTYSGSPVARDIDNDGVIDLISGGTTEAHDQAVIYRFENPLEQVGTPGRTASYQEVQSLHNIQAFVERFYTTILGRGSDPAGNNGWTDGLYTGILTGADVARGFVGSAEFIARGTSNTDFVATLYRAFFGREPDPGLNAWVAQLESGVARLAVVDGFVGSREFSNLATAFGIRAQATVTPGSDAPLQVGLSNASDVLRGGAGGSVLHDGGMASVTGYGAAQTQAAGQVYRLYEAVLGRSPDYGGFQAWFDGLSSGTLTAVQIAGAFAGSAEFRLVYGALDNAAFVTLLYQNVLGRAAAQAEINAWLNLMAGETGQSRAQVALGFANSQEFIRNSNPRLDGFMRSAQPNWNDVIEGGAGNDTMNGGLGADTFVFRRGQGGADVIHGLDPWDELQLSGFGFRNPGDALARMVQSGADVVFDHLGQQITFAGTQLSTMNRLRFNLS
jgi:hypothetical protein